MISIEIPLDKRLPVPSAKVTELVVAKVLKEVLPELDLSVIVNFKDHDTIIVSWTNVG